MMGENEARTSSCFIWLAAELSEWRTTSVLTGSASAAPLAVPVPALVTTMSDAILVAPKPNLCSSLGASVWQAQERRDRGLVRPPRFDMIPTPGREHDDQRGLSAAIPAMPGDGSAARWFADPILRNHRDVGAV